MSEYQLSEFLYDTVDLRLIGKETGTCVITKYFIKIYQEKFHGKILLRLFYADHITLL